MNEHVGSSTHMDDVTAAAPGHRLPNLVRTRAGYRVYDPALVDGTHYAVDDQGDLVYTRLPAGATTASVVIASVGVALWVGDDSWLWTGLTLVAALPVGFALALGLLALVHLATNPARRYRKRTGRSAFAVEVSDLSPEHRRLCRHAERLAASRSWAAGQVDPQRRLQWVLWHAVGEGDADALGELTTLTALVEPATDPDLQAA